MATSLNRVLCFELQSVNERVFVSKQVLPSDNFMHIAATLYKTIFGLGDEIYANDTRFEFYIEDVCERFRLRTHWKYPIGTFPVEKLFLYGCGFGVEYPLLDIPHCNLQSPIVPNSVEHMQEFTFWLSVKVTLIYIVRGCMCTATKPS